MQVPETKGLSLEQVDLLYRECGSIRNANKYRKEMLLRDETFLHHDHENKMAEKVGHHEHVDGMKGDHNAMTGRNVENV